MDILLTDTEVRVLGCLLEKEMATPDYYPLTMNALISACNQKTNRLPVVNYDEDDVAYAINGLKEQRLAYQSTTSRVPKYAQLFSQEVKLIQREKAILCLLFVRGAQTIGEIKNRSDRLYSFKDLEEVQEAVKGLVDAEFVKKLERQPGKKESRYVHLCSGDPISENGDGSIEEGRSGTVIVRREKQEKDNDLQGQIDELRTELNYLKLEFQKFKDQFD